MYTAKHMFQFYFAILKYHNYTQINVHRIDTGQKWFKSKMEILGYEVGPGFCFGVSNMGMQAFLIGDLNRFNDRFRKLSLISDADLLNAIKIKDKRSKLTPQSENPKLDLNDFFAFFDGISLYQSPDIYKHVFDSFSIANQGERKAASLVMPDELEKDPPIELDQFIHGFTRDELRSYLSILSEELSKPTSILINSNDHSISINFDPKTKRWFLIDANYLPSKEYATINSLANDIIKSLCLGFQPTESVVFQSVILTQESNKEAVKKDLQRLKSSKTWKEINSVNGKRVDIADAFKTKLLHLSAKYGHIDTLSEILALAEEPDIVAADDVTALQLASSEGQVDAIELLLKYHSDVNKVNQYGVTPLYYACMSENITVARLLLSHGADVNLSQNGAPSPLHQAISSNNLTVVKFLLQNGADVDLKLDDSTPLEIAISEGNLEIACELIKSGARLDVENLTRNAPLISAAFDNNNQIVKAILEKHTDLDKGIYTSLLLIAVAKDDFELLDYIIDYMPYEENAKLYNQLLFISEVNSFKNVSDKIKSIGANTESVSCADLEFFFFEAVSHGYVELISPLINAGININSMNKDDLCALYIAYKNKDIRMVKTLEEHGANNVQGLKKISGLIDWDGDEQFKLGFKGDNITGDKNNFNKWKIKYKVAKVDGETRTEQYKLFRAFILSKKWDDKLVLPKGIDKIRLLIKKYDDSYEAESDAFPNKVTSFIIELKNISKDKGYSFFRADEMKSLYDYIDHSDTLVELNEKLSKNKDLENIFSVVTFT